MPTTPQGGDQLGTSREEPHDMGLTRDRVQDVHRVSKLLNRRAKDPTQNPYGILLHTKEEVTHSPPHEPWDPEEVNDSAWDSCRPCSHTRCSQHPAHHAPPHRSAPALRTVAQDRCASADIGLVGNHQHWKRPKCPSSGERHTDSRRPQMEHDHQQ